jgi:hypothetical protein
MKTNFLKSIFFVALSTALFTSCVNDDDYSIPNLECNEPVITSTMKTVQAIYNQASPVAKLYEADDVIEAHVVSSDQGGNFYKIIYLNSMDGEIGFSVAVNQVSTFTDYAVGRKVYVKLKGLYTQIRNNTLQIGALFNGNIGQIATTEYKKSVVRACEVVEESTLVNELTLADIKDSNLGKLIEFVNVQFANDALGQNYYNGNNVIGGETNHIITNAAGKTLIFRTGSFAKYAGVSVSPNSGRIRGILTKFGSTYQFVARYASDIQLTEPRLTGGGGGTTNPPIDPTQPTGPVDPPTGTIFFSGGDFENFAAFTTAVGTQFPLSPSATLGTAKGIQNSNALKISGTPTANGFLFSVPPLTNLPANPTKIMFYVRGTTTGKSLSMNIYRAGTGFDAFNLGDLGATGVTLQKVTELNTDGSGVNNYVGTINTNNAWVKVTLNITGIPINTSTTSNIFALKIGKEAAYDLYVDHFTIQ